LELMVVICPPWGHMEIAPTWKQGPGIAIFFR
jgi:hypothetical protein